MKKGEQNNTGKIKSTIGDVKIRRRKPKYMQMHMHEDNWKQLKRFFFVMLNLQTTV